MNEIEKLKEENQKLRQTVCEFGKYIINQNHSLPKDVMDFIIFIINSEEKK